MSRLMPERWFYGSSGNWMLHTFNMDFKEDMRPLRDGERYLGRFIVPPFQRQFVWTEQQQVRLIESIYIGMPIGAIVWNQTTQDNPCDGWLLDGHQRSTTIINYIAGAFPVNGWRYPDLPKSEKVHFDRMSIPVIETNVKDEAICREVYDRLAYGGTQHQ